MNEIFAQQFNTINWDIEPKQLYAPIAYTLESGGKRIRPNLLLMATDLFGGSTKEAIDAATALEIFHNFTLLHDDIMDKSPTRRNKPTVHVKWNDSAAILSGDAMMIKAYQYISKVGEDKLPEVLAVFSQTALEVCEGQQYDMEFETRSDVSLEEYFTMIRLKTAVLLAASLKIGAILGNAHPADANELYKYGIALGMAFQLQDDYLDLYGDFKTFGKPIGGDVLCHKKSFLNLRAMELANSQQKEVLIALFENTSMDDKAKIDQVRLIYDEIGMRTICQDEIQRYHDEALTYLEKVNENAKSKAPLRAIIEKLNLRES